MNLRQTLESRLREAFSCCGVPQDSPAVIAPSPRAEFGDYQASGVMAAAKRLKTHPRQLAQKVAEQLAPGGAADVSDLAEKIEIAGPGFINIFFRQEWLAAQLASMAGDERLGVSLPPQPQTVVVDYSHPNLAREMHVGHLRSTIIGDAICRALDFLGHKVIRQNHVGDWGTLFGKLVAYLDRIGASTSELADLEEFYRKATSLFDSDPQFADTARKHVVRLQGGDPAVLAVWEVFLRESMNHCREVYRRLGVLLTDQDIRGESAYNQDLPRVLEDLDRAGLLTESQGAQCVFLPEFRGKEGEPIPFIVQKSDEGYLYATTDLAAVRYRVRVLHADRVLYVVDARQTFHFRQLFATVRAAGFAPPGVSLEHHPFGMMMGPDGRPFKTREGGTVKLMDLLDEAEKRAFDLVTRKSPDLPEPQRRDIARSVGIGAVKYADLCQNRTSDYVFSFEKMLSLEGNTAPYMQYAYARIRSIFRKGAERVAGGGEGVPPSRGTGVPPIVCSSFLLCEPPERALAVKLLQFPETVQAVGQECLPNILCNYLYELAGCFMGFYENCPVLQSAGPVRAGRLAICDLAARVIRRGLGLLGIDTIERM